jgi:DNA-binding transcriptional LysR family regulator
MSENNRTVSAVARSLAWDDFRLINAIAEARTLPAAALRLGLDHSTVFRRLRQVEAVLGTAVFERHRSGYVLTTAGTEIAALAARVDEDITAVLRRVAGQSPSPAGEVRIATSDALLFDLLLPVLAEFKRACPDVRLDLVTGNTALNLSRRDADVAVRATSSPPETLVGRKVGRIAWAPYAAAAMPVGGNGDAEVFAMDLTWVGFGDALAGLAAAGHLRGKLPDTSISCRFDTVGAIVAGIEAGLGAGLLPCFAGDRRPGLVRLAPPIAALATDLWLLTHADLRRVPRVSVLMEFLGQRLSALRPVLDGSQDASNGTALGAPGEQ